MSNEPERLSCETARRMLHSSDRNTIDKWNQVCGSGQHPYEWSLGINIPSGGLTIHRYDTSRTNLFDINLTLLDFHANFELHCCDMDGASFSDVLAKNITLTNCTFRNTTFKNLKWHKCKITKCKFSECRFEQCDFSNADFSGSQFLGSLSFFDHALLADRRDGLPAHKPSHQGTGIKDKSAWLVDCNFHNAILLGVEFHDARINRCVFTNTRMNSDTLLDLRFNDSSASFDGSGYKSARIPPATAANIAWTLRRSYWLSVIYGTHEAASASPWRRVYSFFTRAFWWSFWGIAGFGLSLHRQAIITLLAYSFFVFMSFVVACHGAIEGIDNAKPMPMVFIHCMYFTAVTMTTLGYGDMSASIDSIAAQLLVIGMVGTGYTLFGALIARLITIVNWPE